MLIDRRLVRPRDVRRLLPEYFMPVKPFSWTAPKRGIDEAVEYFKNKRPEGRHGPVYTRKDLMEIGDAFLAKEEKVPPKAQDDQQEGMEDATTTEFTVRRSELMADVKAGAFGRIVIPVKVLDVGEGKVFLQKDGEIKVDGEFSDSEPLESMKRRIGMAEDR